MKIKNVKTVKNLKAEVKKIVELDESKSKKIKALFELGVEVKEIAKQLDIRYNFAYNVISNYILADGIEVVKEVRANKKDAVRKLYRENKKAKEIAVELKTNLNYVYKLIKEIKEELKGQAVEIPEEVPEDLKEAK